jgi:hypothetical protein
MTRLKCSPHSSRDGGESTQGTPDTKITAFSPEDARSIKPSVTKSPGTLMGIGHHDPFVTAIPKQKTGKFSQDRISSYSCNNLVSVISIPLPLFRYHFPVPLPLALTHSHLSHHFIRFQTVRLSPFLTTSCTL